MNQSTHFSCSFEKVAEQEMKEWGQEMRQIHGVLSHQVQPLFIRCSEIFNGWMSVYLSRWVNVSSNFLRQLVLPHWFTYCPCFLLLFGSWDAPLSSFPRFLLFQLCFHAENVRWLLSPICLHSFYFLGLLMSDFSYWKVYCAQQAKKTEVQVKIVSTILTLVRPSTSPVLSGGVAKVP